MRRFVLDASTTLAWSLEDEPALEAESVFSALQQYRALVPVSGEPIGPSEHPGLLQQTCRRSIIDVDDAASLELAVRHALPLASHDKSMRAAAARCGVELFVSPGS